MKATQLLHNLGQSIWLDNITRDLLDSGTLQRYIDELSVTGPERSYAVTSVFVTNRVFFARSSRFVRRFELLGVHNLCTYKYIDINHSDQYAVFVVTSHAI
jgi:hypothetical protein